MSDFQTMDEIVNKFFAQPAFAKLAYCDYIAHIISTNLKAVDTTSEKLLASVGRPQYHLGPNGEFASTQKTIEVEDRYGKKYKITVEEA
jgi:hypothetical protein